LLEFFRVGLILFTDKQTNGHWRKHNLFGGGNNLVG